MAIITLSRGDEVITVFTGCNLPIMTAGAGTGDTRMVKACRCPGVGAVAIIAGITALYMGCMLAGGRGAIMAG